MDIISSTKCSLLIKDRNNQKNKKAILDDQKKINHQKIKIKYMHPRVFTKSYHFMAWHLKICIHIYMYVYVCVNTYTYIYTNSSDYNTCGTLNYFLLLINPANHNE